MSWRRAYSWLWIGLAPLIKRYLRRRGKQSPAYLEHWDERFAENLSVVQQAPIWIHAVSVGETRAALPLVQALRQTWPRVPLLLTQMTPTGRATALELYPDAEVRYLPYDSKEGIQRFLDTYQPRLGILMETEIWPNLIHGCYERSIPLFLANARLSEKSLKGYLRIAGLIRPALAQLRGIAAQTREDAQRLEQLGAQAVCVCGNTKFDFTPPDEKLALGAEFRLRIGARQVVVCGSTRDGEESLILEAWAKRKPDDTLLVIVPRHPERFDMVYASAQALGFRVQRRSEGDVVDQATQIWLGDSMGELFAYYALAELAFVGGSLLPLGGQNLIEPASIGVPVLFGPSMFNFAEASDQALACGAALQLVDADEFVSVATALLKNTSQRAAMRDAALAFTRTHQGASQRIINYIRQQTPGLSV
ncbi:lipid IV(A) 3-deoxy-D-manno-octulosonic acid transferase [Craterilacuibacter sp.]|uniref:lipid IV(A) 3-deoxy-D-manno-octulosonic acid transferase n=1 Tax=Craterilacuibacter sp. TaxID=2870909 RepID=UPI003F2BDF90